MQDAKRSRIRRKYQSLHPEMDERLRRQWAAAEARDLGWGGVIVVARATGLSRTTITAGLRELDQPARQRAAQPSRVRRARRRAATVDGDGPELLAALEALVEPVTPWRPGVAACAGPARARGAWPRN